MSTKLYFETNYPAISYFAKNHGWVEVGLDGLSSSLVRAVDDGGLIWEATGSYENLDEAIQDLEINLLEYLMENDPDFKG